MKVEVAISCVAFSLLGGCTAATQVARPVDEAPLRGSVEASGPSVKALRAGPTVLHVYSAFTGGHLYVVRAATGTDADCAPAGARVAAEASEPIEAGRRVSFWVEAGQIACVSTGTTSAFKLLWHAHEEPVAAYTTLAAAPRIGSAIARVSVAEQAP
jgi:hypothetical protein